MTESDEKIPNGSEKGSPVSSRFFTFLFLGFALVVVGMIVVLLGTVLSGGTTSFSGFIFIGPFPIVIGAGPDSAWLITVALVIALSIAVFVIMRRRI